MRTASISAIMIALTITITPASPAPEAATSQPPPAEETIAAAIRALGSDNFGEREAASRKVWELGRAAELLLKEAVENGDAELRYRGGKILDEFRLGIYPDTPEDLRALIENYRKGDAAARQMAVQELATRGETALLIRLVKRERDPAMRDTVASLIAQNVAEMAPEYIFNGEMQQAEDLLQLAALSSRGMRDYTTFLFTTGKLDTALTKQRARADDTRVDAELLGWMLRVKGESAEAAAVFEAIGNSARARDARASGGDMLAYAQSFTDPSRRTVDTLAYAAAAARLSGDDDALEKLLADIVEYAKAMPDEAGRCINALIINGAPARAFELAANFDDGNLLGMEKWRYDFDAAFETLGATADDAPFDDWLKEFEKNFDVRDDKDVHRAILPAGQLASICTLTGQEDTAAHILRTVASLLRAKGNSLLPLMQWGRLLRLDELAREYALETMELEIEANVLNALFPMRADYAWLTTSSWEYLRTKYPDESKKTTLGRMSALFDSKPDPTAAKTIAVIDASAREADGEERKKLLAMVVDLARLHGLWELAADATGRWLPMLGAEVAAFHHTRYGEALLSSEQPLKAAEQFEKAWAMAPSNPLPLYMKGVALAQSGDPAAAGLKHKASLMAIGSVSKRHFLANAMWQNGDEEAAREQDRLLLRIASPHEGVHPEALRRSYADIKTSGTAAQAARALEFYLLSKMRPVNAGSVISPRTALAYHVNLGKLQARAKFDGGEAAAAAAMIAELQEINPSDSSVLEDMYQLLCDAGLTTEADALFETTHKVSKSTVDRFPGHAQHHNNHAWLLSRCTKKLDEGLVHAQRAVEMEPTNGAFLDTLAEVYFQRGDRALAIATSEKAVALLASDPQVMTQLERFKTGKPTDR